MNDALFISSAVRIRTTYDPDIMRVPKNHLAVFLSRTQLSTGHVSINGNKLMGKQEHLMLHESCLKVDESDRVLGWASKKVCASYLIDFVSGLS